jgi:hypothetical protein
MLDALFEFSILLQLCFLAHNHAADRTELVPLYQQKDLAPFGLGSLHDAKNSDSLFSTNVT